MSNRYQFTKIQSFINEGGTLCGPQILSHHGMPEASRNNELLVHISCNSDVSDTSQYVLPEQINCIDVEAATQLLSNPVSKHTYTILNPYTTPGGLMLHCAMHLKDTTDAIDKIEKIWARTSPEQQNATSIYFSRTLMSALSPSAFREPYLGFSGRDDNEHIIHQALTNNASIRASSPSYANETPSFTNHLSAILINDACDKCDAYTLESIWPVISNIQSQGALSQETLQNYATTLTAKLQEVLESHPLANATQIQELQNSMRHAIARGVTEYHMVALGVYGPNGMPMHEFEKLFNAFLDAARDKIPDIDSRIYGHNKTQLTFESMPEAVEKYRDIVYNERSLKHLYEGSLHLARQAYQNCVDTHGIIQVYAAALPQDVARQFCNNVSTNFSELHASAINELNNLMSGQPKDVVDHLSMLAACIAKDANTIEEVNQQFKDIKDYLSEGTREEQRD